MKKLSIVILFCDKDAQYINDMLHYIKVHIKCNYEVILVNNCVSITEPEIRDIIPYKLVTKGYNCYLFEGRRFGFEQTCGDYVWFVDVDDKIVNDITQEDLDNWESDLIQSYFKASNHNEILIGDCHDDIKGFGKNVWSRIYKHSLLEKVYSQIERRDLKIVGNEDMALNFLVKDQSPTIQFFDKYIYFYNQRRCQQLVEVITESRLDHLLLGYDDLIYLSSFMKDKESFIDILNHNVEYTKSQVGKLSVDWSKYDKLKKLSIVIVFCDKDYKYLNKCLESITNYVHCEYEIILVNNCENTEIDELDTEIKLINTHRNTGPWEGRRIGSDAATGNYVWYIDVDDYLIGNLFQWDFETKNSDIIQMYFSQNNYVGIKPGEMHYRIKNFGFNVWSRLYKKSTLDRLYAPIKRRDLKIMRLEDKFIFDLVMSSIPSISFIDRVIYYYDVDNATICNKSITQETYDKYVKGTSDLPYLYSFVPNTEKYLKEVESIMNSYKSMIK